MDLDKVTIFIRSHGSGQILPPQVQQPLFANETEPRRKQEFGIVHHVNKLLSSDPLASIDLIRMGFDGQFALGLDAKEENIVDLVFSPRTATMENTIIPKQRVS